MVTLPPWLVSTDFGTCCCCYYHHYYYCCCCCYYEDDDIDDDVGDNTDEGDSDNGIQRAKELIYLSNAVAQLVEALRYKSEGRGFDSR
jgi:hypothetical protein